MKHRKQNICSHVYITSSRMGGVDSHYPWKKPSPSKKNMATVFRHHGSTAPGIYFYAMDEFSCGPVHETPEVKHW